MPIDVKKTTFFSNGHNLGEPAGLGAKKFLTLDTSRYLEQIDIDTGNAITQLVDEAQLFDLRYDIFLNSQYSYNATSIVSGTVKLPAGANPVDYEVKVYTFTDQTYLQETCPISSSNSWTTLATTTKGNKIARLVTKDEALVLAEAYVTNPTDGPRLPRSYNVDPHHDAFETLRYRSFIYDVAVYTNALISQEKEADAALMCLAMLKTQQRNQTDDAGNTENQNNDDRFPFSVYLHNPQFLIDAYYRTGAESWVIYALLRFAEEYPSNGNTANLLSRAMDAEIALYNMEYVISTGLQHGSYRGGHGGYTTELDEENNQLVYVDFDPDLEIGWCANEHNTDMYWVHKLITQLASVITENFNAVRLTATNAWKSASKTAAGGASGNVCLEIVPLESNKSVMAALSETAAGTTLNDDTASADGVSVLLDASGNIYYREDGGTSTDTGVNYVAGDVITLERAAAGGFKIYKNGTLIHTATFTTTAAVQAHVGVFHQNGEIHKIQTWQNTLENKAYDRTYPLRTFDSIHADLSQNVMPGMKSRLEAALVSSTQYWNATEERGRRGISDDSTLDDCHALDNMTWYGMVLRDMSETTKSAACLDYILNGDDGSYSNWDLFYSAQSFKPYIPNNGCYTTPVSTSLTWTEGSCGYIILDRAEGNTDDATDGIKEIAKIIRPDGIPYVTKPDPIYELQDWGCLIAPCWVILANDPNGFWDLTYDALIT